MDKNLHHVYGNTLLHTENVSHLSRSEQGEYQCTKSNAVDDKRP